jgi:class 3 adenylate cyclase/predicted ATPase
MMTFEEILDQAMAMLQRRGRVTYRTLRLQFQLDEDQLEALKEALIEAERLAVDEEGRVLVWAGAPVSPPPVSASQEVTLGNSPVRAALGQDVPATAAGQIPHPSDAERRQLTVLFCDLADSTRLARQLDPEDLRAVVRAYQETAASVIQRYEGHIAQYLGDGLLVYFGYPQAHEDDAQRAVRTGLGLLVAMQARNTRLVQDQGVRLAVRIGIHTGPVVVGAIGSDDRREHLALGDTPNLAARLQGLAEPDTVVLSDTTARLVQGYFVCQDRGVHTLKGMDTPVRVARVVGESPAQSRLDVAAASGFTPLVGRETEVTLLRERWAQACDGLGQVVLLSGEAGIGKSRLVRVLTEHVVAEGAPRLTLHCSPYHTNSAFYPVIDHLQRLLHWHRDVSPEARLATLEQAIQAARLPLEEAVPLLAALLAVPLLERYPPLTLSPQRQKQQTQEALVTWLLAETAQHPVLAVWEDLHWADPSTLELLGLLLDQVPTARLLLVLTARPEFRPPWGLRAHLTQLTLTRLARQQVEEMVLRVTGGKPLPAEVVQQIVAKTDGIPLFVEELVKTVLESGLVREDADRYILAGPLPPLAIPATLQDALMARLDRLAAVKEVAQLGAVLGREFPYALLRAVTPLEEPTLQQSLAQLVEAELLYQRGHPPQAIYVFKHALVQDAAYQSLLRSTRQQYHQRIARVLEAQFPALVDTQPELLAQHYTEAGLTAQAIGYWQQAGQRAGQRSTNLEAVAHLTKGLALLKTLPDSSMALQQELDMQVDLGLALMMLKSYGAPEVEQAYARARELCQHVGETPQLFPVLQGLWAFYFGRAAHQTARELGEQLLGLAQSVQDPALLLQAHRALGISLFYLGELAPGHAHLEQGAALYDPQQHRALAFSAFQNPGVTCRCFAARTLWYLGFPDQALAQSQAGIRLAQDVAHPFSLAFALNIAAVVQQHRREERGVQERAEATIILAHEQGFPFYEAFGTMQRGWSLVAQGQHAEGIEQTRQGLAAYRATGSAVALPYGLALLAEAYATGGQVVEGLRVLAEAFALVDTQGERDYQAELYRLQGALLLAQEGTRPQEREAEQCFHQAIEIARRQQAKSLELRAAVSLSRLWHQQGKHAEAHALLAPIYAWFTEGFDTADLQEAKALLETLA